MWPECHISWIVDCAAAQLLEEHPAVDEVIRLRKHWLKYPGEWRNLRDQLRSSEFDCVFDPQGLTKSSLLGWLSGCHTRLGYDYSHGREIAPLLATQRVHRSVRHMVDTHLLLLQPWREFAPGSGQFQMPIYETAAARADEILLMADNACHRFTGDLPLSQGRIGINPGASSPRRIWPVERYGIVARELFEQFGMRSIVFWNGEAEKLMAQVIAEQSRGSATVVPETNLCELAELIRRCNLFICGDTGPLHIASAMGTPTVGLHGVTWADESGSYGNCNLAVQSPLVPVNRRQRRHGPSFAMQAIEIEEVLQACRHVLCSSQRAAA